MKRSSQRNNRAFLFAGLTLSGALVACLVTGASDRDLQLVAGVVLLLVIAGTVITDVLLGRFHLANAKYFILFAFALFLGGGMLVDATRIDFALDPAAILFTYGALLCLLLGFAVSGHGSASRQQRPSSTFPLTGEQIFFITLFFFALGFLFVVLEWILYGQIQNYAGKSMASGLPSHPVMPYVQTFTQFLMPAVILAFVQLRRGISLPRRALLLLLLTAAVAWYLVWGARGNFLWVAIAFLLVWAEIDGEHGSKLLGAKPAVVLALSACAILALGVVRTTWDVHRAEEAGLGGIWQQARHSLDTYSQLVRTLDYFPARVAYLRGYSFYGVISNPVPRSLWPAKPIGVGKLASILYDGNAANSIGLSLPGELYANFGYTGALLGMFLFGILAAHIEVWYTSQRGDPIALVLYLIALFCMMAEIRGDILDATAPVLYTLLPAAICFGIFAAANRRFFSIRKRDGARHRSKPEPAPLRRHIPGTV